MVLQATGAAGKPRDGRRETGDRGDEMQPGHTYISPPPYIINSRREVCNVYRIQWVGMVWYGIVWYGVVWYGMVVRVWGHVNMAVVPKIIIPASPRMPLAAWLCICAFSGAPAAFCLLHTFRRECERRFVNA